MKIPRLVRRLLLIAFLGLLLAALLLAALWAYYHPRFERVNGIAYGTRNGQNLTFDVLRPAKPNGIGIVVMASGQWRSGGPGAFASWIAAPFLRRGYTVFAVYHTSQPEATVMEIVAQVNRAVRYVRHTASQYGVNPEKLGVTGGSSGGHLALMLATRGGPGPDEASDPVERESSAVQAVAIFYPPTDLLNLGESTENPGDGGPPKSFVRAFGKDSTNMTIWKVIGREMSPIYHVRSNLPPTLIVHGDADTLVPLDQSQRYAAAVTSMGGSLELLVHKGGQHGWPSMAWDVRRFADWFDKHLRPR